MFSFFKNALVAQARFTSTFSATTSSALCVDKANLTKEKVHKFTEHPTVQRDEGNSNRQAVTPTAAARSVSASSLSEIEHADGFRPFLVSPELGSSIQSHSISSILVGDYLHEKRPRGVREGF